MAHDEHGISRNVPAGTSTGERPDAAVVAATSMGYGMGTSSSPQVPPGPHGTMAGYQHHPHYYPTGGTSQSRGKDDMEGDGDANERRYKRYKTH